VTRLATLLQQVTNTKLNTQIGHHHCSHRHGRSDESHQSFLRIMQNSMFLRMRLAAEPGNCAGSNSRAFRDSPRSGLDVVRATVPPQNNCRNPGGKCSKTTSGRHTLQPGQLCHGVDRHPSAPTSVLGVSQHLPIQCAQNLGHLGPWSHRQYFSAGNHQNHTLASRSGSPNESLSARWPKPSGPRTARYNLATASLRRIEHNPLLPFSGSRAAVAGLRCPASRTAGRGGLSSCPPITSHRHQGNVIKCCHSTPVLHAVSPYAGWQAHQETQSSAVLDRSCGH